MTPLTLRQIAAALARRLRADRNPQAPSKWTTAAGDTAEVFPARPGPGNPQKWYWRIVAPNGQIIATSGQGFTRRRSARRALARSFPPAASS